MESQRPAAATWICSSQGFAFYKPVTVGVQSWASTALAIASDFAFWKETLRRIFKVWFNFPHETEAIKKDGAEAAEMFVS